MSDRPEDITAEDATLLGELSSALLSERPIPAGLTDLAEMTFAWRSINEELAALTFDSAETLMPVRSDVAVRVLAFELDDVRIDLQIDMAAGRLIGQVDPMVEGRATLIHRDGERNMPIEELGTFSFDYLPHGPIAVRLTLADRVVRTEWLLP